MTNSWFCQWLVNSTGRMVTSIPTLILPSPCPTSSITVYLSQSKEQKHSLHERTNEFFSLSLQNGCSISLDMTTIRPSKHQSNDQHRWKLIFWVIHGPTNATLSLTRRTWHSLTLPCSLENPFFPSFLEAGGTTLIKLEYPMSPPFFAKCWMLILDV